MIISNLNYKANDQVSSNTVATTSNNVMFSCYSEYDDNNTWQIRVYRSDNNGITWRDSGFPTITGYNQTSPSIAIDSGDNIHVIWSGYDSQNSSYTQIKYCTSYNGGVTWKTPVNIQSLGGYTQQNPQLIIDPNTNIIHVTWQGTDNNNANSQIKYCRSTDGGSTWSFFKNVQIPGTSYTQLSPEIVVDNNSVIHIVWFGNDATYTSINQIKYSKSVDNGITWSTWININPIVSYNQVSPSITVDSANKLHLCWSGLSSTSAGIYQIKYASSVNGSTWSNTQTLTNSTVYNQSNPAIINLYNKYDNRFKAITDSSAATTAEASVFTTLNNELYNFYVITKNVNGSNARVLLGRKLVDGTWTAINNGNYFNSNLSNNRLNPIKAHAFNNKIYLTYIEQESYNGNNINALRMQVFDGATWSYIDGNKPLNNDTTINCDYFDMTDYNNELYIFFIEGTSSKLYGRKFDGTNWNLINGGAAFNVSTNNSIASAVKYGKYKTDLYVFWSEANSENSNAFNIYGKKFDGTTWTLVNGGTSLNYTISNYGFLYSTIEYNNNFYIVTQEYDQTNSSNTPKLRIKKFDGTTWSSADNGTNINESNKNVDSAKFFIMDGLLYIVYPEIVNSNGQIRIKRYDGTFWSYADNNLSLNFNTNCNSNVPHAILNNGTLYIGWIEYSSSTGSIIRMKYTTNLSVVPNIGLHIIWSAQSNTTVNNRLCLVTSTSGGATWSNQRYLTSVTNNVSNFSVYPNNNYLLIMYSSYSAMYLQKCGFKKYLIQDGMDIKTYDSTINGWKTIGSTTITDDMFDKYGFTDLSIINMTNLNLLTSISPLLAIKDLGMEYDKPQIRITGDRKSNYHYRVTMQNILNPIKPLTQSYNYNINDIVTIPSNLITTANPYNIFVDVIQEDDGNTITRKGSVTLIDEKPVILATINGSRLDITIDDPERDKVQFNIKLNDTKVYPTVGDYTSLVTTPFNFSYIFKTTQINIGQNNIVTITSKDSYGKISTMTLNFTGIYVGLIFTDPDGNRYSTDRGDILKLLDFGKIKAGDTTNPVKVYLNNLNGFTINNTKVWLDSSVVGGTVQISKTLNPFVPDTQLTFSENFNNGELKEFYIRITSNPSDTPGGGTFKIYTKAQMA